MNMRFVFKHSRGSSENLYYVLTVTNYYYPSHTNTPSNTRINIFVVLFMVPFIFTFMFML